MTKGFGGKSEAVLCELLTTYHLPHWPNIWPKVKAKKRERDGKTSHDKSVSGRQATRQPWSVANTYLAKDSRSRK